MMVAHVAERGVVPLAPGIRHVDLAYCIVNIAASSPRHHRRIADKFSIVHGATRHAYLEFQEQNRKK